jgi:uncharacterized protein YndB with AHSA1/START domain
MAASDTAPAQDFVLTRIFKAPRQRVWDAWTRPEMLMQWFGPKGVTTTVLQSELRPGGMLHAAMDSPGGGRLWARFVYREVVPPSRLVWVHSFSDEKAGLAPSPFGGPWPLEWLTMVTFEEAGDDTRVVLTCSPLNATPEEQAAFSGATLSMEGGWGGSFEQLDLYLARPA